ncbi:MAG: hypothetical protein H0X35_10725 [Pseudonocardiales bacterium]|nr:hypothetical protein [Pseudonocardiales bacterium]
MSAAPNPADSSARTTTVVLAFGIGTLVAVGLGVYARVHDASFFAFNIAGFSSGGAAKAWLATIAFLFALVQLVSALIMYGRINIAGPPWIGTLHRWSGRIAVLVTVPVAVHCLYALGFETDVTRGLVHSIAGCFFYGAFVAKMLVLQRHQAPGWALPVLGGAVFTALTVLWLTAAAWFFTTSGIHF